MPPAPAAWQVADAFELPDWLGETFTWQAEETLAGGCIPGRVTGAAGQVLALDLLCGDVAFPTPVMGQELRSQVHQAWHYTQVLIVLGEECRHTLAVPTSQMGAELACEALRRFAKAVGISARDVRVTLRL
jgi:hypothetical protein